MTARASVRGSQVTHRWVVPDAERKLLGKSPLLVSGADPTSLPASDAAKQPAEKKKPAKTPKRK